LLRVDSRFKSSFFRIEINMAEEIDNNHKFNIKDYVERVNDASIRTRTVSVVLVIATVLIAIGFYNSLQWSWARDRIKRAFDSGDFSIFTLMDAENHPKFKSDSLFIGNDFADFKSIALKLAEAKDEDLLPKYIYDERLLQSKAELTEYIENYRLAPDDKKPAPTVVLVALVAKDFNALLKDKSLYKPERFAGVRLKNETKQMLENQPFGGSDLVRFNRLLLEDYFPDEIIKSRDFSPSEDYRKEVQRSLVFTYIENIRYIKIPFFGIAFDVNDLGTIGGLGLLIILIMFRYSLSREIKNLRYAFKKSRQHGYLDDFYHALAMKQVFTVPKMKRLKRNKKLALSYIFVPLLPALIFTAGVFYDWWSVIKTGVYNYRDAKFTLWIELLWWVPVWILALRCAERIFHIDEIWKAQWGVLMSEKSIRRKYRLIRKYRKIKRRVRKNGVVPLIANTFKTVEFAESEAVLQPAEQPDTAEQVDTADETTEKNPFIQIPLIVFTCFLIISAVAYAYQRLAGQRSLTAESIALAAMLIAGIGTASTLVLGWRNEIRSSREANLKNRILEKQLNEFEEKEKEKSRSTNAAKNSTLTASKDAGAEPGAEEKAEEKKDDEPEK
jgi:hypothetical protein